MKPKKERLKLCRAKLRKAKLKLKAAQDSVRLHGSEVRLYEIMRDTILDPSPMRQLTTPARSG